MQKPLVVGRPYATRTHQFVGAQADDMIPPDPVDPDHGLKRWQIAGLALALAVAGTLLYAILNTG